MHYLPVELQIIALDTVSTTRNSWLTSTDIKQNLQDKGFIINNKIDDNCSSLIFTKDKQIKMISIKEDLVENEKIKLLLMYYSYYKLSNNVGNGFIRIYDKKGIKRVHKDLGNLIQDYSVEKEIKKENEPEEKVKVIK